MRTILCLLILMPALATAGGSNYTVPPGVSQPTGKVSEWPVPTPKFARDPAVAPDGRIYIAVMHGNRLARFDRTTGKMTDFPTRDGPYGLAMDQQGNDGKGRLWYMGSHSENLAWSNENAQTHSDSTWPANPRQYIHMQTPKVHTVARWLSMPSQIGLNSAITRA